MARIHPIESNSFNSSIPKSPEKRWFDNLQKPMTEEESDLLMKILHGSETNEPNRQ